MSASFYDLMKYARTGIASPSMTYYDKQKALAMCKSGFPISTITGATPLSFKSDGTPLSAYSITGNMIQTGTPTPDTPIIPEETGDRTANLFDKNSNVVAYYLTQTTGVYTATGSTSRSILIPCEPSTSYTILIPANRTLRIVSFSHYPQPGDSGDKYESQETGLYIEKEYTYTTSSNARYMCVCCYNSALEATVYTESEYFDGIMLNTGSTALPYEPYGYKIDISCNDTQTVYLSEPIREIGDHADAASAVGTVGTVTRPIKKLVLTGQETWSTITTGVTRYYTPLADAMRNSPCFCTHFIDGQASLYGCCDIADSKNFIINGSGIQSVEEWLATQYAAGTPVCVWYVLANPVTETFTAPTITPAYGSNTLSVGTTLQPSSVSLTGGIK